MNATIARFLLRNKTVAAAKSKSRTGSSSSSSSTIIARNGRKFYCNSGRKLQGRGVLASGLQDEIILRYHIIIISAPSTAEQALTSVRTFRICSGFFVCVWACIVSLCLSVSAYLSLTSSTVVGVEPANLAGPATTLSSVPWLVESAMVQKALGVADVLPLWKKSRGETWHTREKYGVRLANVGHEAL